MDAFLPIFKSYKTYFQVYNFWYSLSENLTGIVK